MIRRLLDKSGDTISWLMDKGVAFCDVVHHTPNQAPEVFHITSAEENAGSVVVRCLKQFCLEHGVTLLTKTKGKSLGEGRIRRGHWRNLRAKGRWAAGNPGRTGDRLHRAASPAIRR